MDIEIVVPCVPRHSRPGWQKLPQPVVESTLSGTTLLGSQGVMISLSYLKPI